MVILGRIVTMDDPSMAEALLIENGMVTAVGTRTDVLALLGDQVPIMDIVQNVAYPGFIDAHAHWIGDRDYYGLATPAEAMGAALSRGWTSISEQWVNPERLDVLETLAEDDALPLRVDAYLALNAPAPGGEHFGDWYADREPGPATDRLRVQGLKITLDNGWAFWPRPGATRRGVRSLLRTSGRALYVASTGQVVVNAATGERVVFRTLARDSAGELLRLDVFFAPGAGASAAHIHPHQAERFEILEGSLTLRVGRETKVAEAGDVIVVPAGTPHRPRNVGEIEVRCVAEFRPALNIETFFENAFALLSARGSRTTVPMVLELAELLSHYAREVQATPAPLRLVTMLAAPIGKAVGYAPRFPVEA